MHAVVVVQVGTHLGVAVGLVDAPPMPLWMMLDPGTGRNAPNAPKSVYPDANHKFLQIISNTFEILKYI
jgi:hypothetical protein